MNKYLFSVEIAKGVFAKAKVLARDYEEAMLKVDLNDCVFDDIEILHMDLMSASDVRGNDIMDRVVNEYWEDRRDVD
jgi:hypothetical protein